MSDSSSRTLPALFRDLLAVYTAHADRIEAPDRQARYADILAILSVFQGTKNAFMVINKSEAHDAFFHQISDVVRPYGLHGVFAKAPAWKRRELDCDPYFKIALDALYARTEAHEEQAPEFWIIKDPALLAKFENGEYKTLSEAELLGYPQCCADYWFEAFIAPRYELLPSFAQTFDEPDSEVLAWLDKMKGAPSVAEMLGLEWLNYLIWRSNSVIPFVHFTACPHCLRSKDSPAKRINLQTQEIAKAVSPDIFRYLFGYRREAAESAEIFRRDHLERWRHEKEQALIRAAEKRPVVERHLARCQRIYDLSR